MNKKTRLGLSIALVALTIAAFVYYLSKHRSLLTSLRRTSPMIILWALLLYVLIFGVILQILHVSLRMCHKRVGAKENLQLNAYSLFVNFFMPGQGGPAIRGLYLKKRHGLKIRSYILVSLLYYAIYAVTSAFLLLAGSRPWWWTALGTLAAGGGSWLIIRMYMRRSKLHKDGLDLRPRLLLALLGVTTLQAALQIALYGVELRAVDPHIGFVQAMTYTGAANFSLFVALTPGAIGIRESFLLFSERLHHISSTTIVAANVIDRGVYLVFLSALFVLTLVLHAKKSLQLKRLQASRPED